MQIVINYQSIDFINIFEFYPFLSKIKILFEYTKNSLRLRKLMFWKFLLFFCEKLA